MVRAIKIIFITIIVAFLVLVIPIPTFVNFSQQGFRLHQSGDYIEHNVHLSVRMTRWRSLAGFNRINGTIEIDGNIVFSDFSINHVAINDGTHFGNFAAVDLTNNQFVPVVLYFNNSFDTFAVLISRPVMGDLIPKYYVATATRNLNEAEAVSFFKSFIPELR